jgi:hypothetical protein
MGRKGQEKPQAKARADYRGASFRRPCVGLIPHVPTPATNTFVTAPRFFVGASRKNIIFIRRSNDW